VFGNVGWAEMVVLLVAALVILGPERLPGAVQWTARSLRQVRDYASGATAQLKEEMGPEFDDLRKPLSEINQLRGMTPRSAITKHLLDGDDSIFTGKFDSAAESAGAPQQPSRRQKPLEVNEQPPIDPDAT
jgi:sec-independent protein translocase protein TatB